MEKIIKIGEYELPVKSTAAALFSYKSNFGRDGLRDLISLAKGIPTGSDIKVEDIIANDNFDLDVFFRFLWIFAKSADKGIPPIEQWLEGFEVAPFDFVAEVLPQIQELLMSTVKSNVKSKN